MLGRSTPLVSGRFLRMTTDPDDFPGFASTTDPTTHIRGRAAPAAVDRTNPATQMAPALGGELWVIHLPCWGFSCACRGGRMMRRITFLNSLIGIAVRSVAPRGSLRTECNPTETSIPVKTRLVPRWRMSASKCDSWISVVALFGPAHRRDPGPKQQLLNHEAPK